MQALIFWGFESKSTIVQTREAVLAADLITDHVVHLIQSLSGASSTVESIQYRRYRRYKIYKTCKKCKKCKNIEFGKRKKILYFSPPGRPLACATTFLADLPPSFFLKLLLSPYKLFFFLFEI